MRGKELLSRRRCPWEITSTDSTTTPRVKVYDTGPARLIKRSFEVGTVPWNPSTPLLTCLNRHLTSLHFTRLCHLARARHSAPLPVASLIPLQKKYATPLIVTLKPECCHPPERPPRPGLRGGFPTSGKTTPRPVSSTCHHLKCRLSQPTPPGCHGL